MNSQQVQDIRLMYEAVYNEELREKANEYNSIEDLDEARVDAGLSKEEKRKARTARQGYAGAQLRHGSHLGSHTGDVDRRVAHRERDELNKDAKEIRRGRLDRPQFQGETGRERVDQVKKAKGMKEDIDLFDYLLEYLVAEGYADTNQDALVIMANMNKEQIEEATRLYYKLQRKGKGGSETAKAQERSDADLETQKNLKMKQQRQRQMREREPDDDDPRQHGSLSAAERNPSMR
jgi:hypothetical protein